MPHGKVDRHCSPEHPPVQPGAGQKDLATFVNFEDKKANLRPTPSTRWIEGWLIDVRDFM
jgi:hypothetical protein